MKTYKMTYQQNCVEKTYLIEADNKDEAEALLKKRKGNNIRIIIIQLT